MKTLLSFLVVAFLGVLAPHSCLAEMTIEDVSRDRARELGLEIRAKPAGPDAVRIELEFELKGALKKYDRVELEFRDGKKLLVTTALREEHPKSGRIVVSFAADRAHLDKATLMMVVMDVPLGGSGYQIRVKDFVELEKLR
jgi:hypothetical protein